MPATASHTRHTVTAVIVAHDGAEVLPGLGRALTAQTHSVERAVGVDTGSLDRSAALLTELLGPDAVLVLPRGTGFGAAVGAALRHGAASRALPADPDIRRVEWVWLLHDDCEPAPDALERLLKAASRDRSVVVLGPKVLDATDRRTLRETGIAIDRAGRRVTGIEPGEIDQGQHDGDRPVLAVGSAGMLVRRDAWDRLGGFDPRLELFRDDLDFCWRAHGAGYGVRVVTSAVLYHRELSARRRRGGRAEATRFRRLDRRNALFVLAVSLPLLRMLTVLAGCAAGSLLRASWFLLTKQKDLASAHGYAVTWLLLHPASVWQGRRLRAEGRDAAYAAVRSFIPSGRTLSRLGEDIAALLAGGPPPGSGGRHQAVSLGDDGDNEQFTDQPSLALRFIGHPGVQLAIALTLVALVAERRLLGTSPLGGGALVPAWRGVSGLWSEYLAGFHAVGLGSTASAPPYVAVVALLATVLGGQTWLALGLLLLGCVPLAGITAYCAARRLVTPTAVRLLLAASYALTPVAIGAVATGRLGTAVAFVLLPLIAISAGRLLTSAPRAARRAAWATGLLVALAAAFSPLVWLIAVVLTAVAVAVRRWLWPVSRIDAAIVAGTPLLLLFPWSLHLLTHPSALLSEAGVPAASTGPSLPAPALLLLSPGGPGLPPAWVTAGLALAVAAAFGPRRHRLLTATGWAVAAVGYLLAVIVSRTTVVPGAGRVWPGTALAVTALGLLIAAAPAAEWLFGLTRSSGSSSASASSVASSSPAGSGLSRGTGSRAALAVTVLAAAATVPVLAAAFWVTGGVRGPVARVSQPLLPAFVAASSGGPGQYRTLVLRPAPGGVAFSVLRDGDPYLGEPELTGYGPADQALSRQVAALTARDGADSGDPGQTLGSFGIHWVLLPGPVSQVLERRLDAASGLVPLSRSAAYDLWQVGGTADRARVIAPDGTVTPVASRPDDVSGAPVPASGGTLVLAEPYGGWTARLNGTALRPLPAPVGGWAQGFVLPKGGGTVSISRSGLARDLSLMLEVVALLVIGVLAIPGKRDDPAEEAEAIAAVRAAQHDRRVARAAKTRELTRAAAVHAMESGLARRALPGIVASFPPGSASVGRALGAIRPRRARRLAAVPDRHRKPVALPPAPSALALPPAPSVPAALPPAPAGPPVPALPPAPAGLPVPGPEAVVPAPPEPVLGPPEPAPPEPALGPPAGLAQPSQARSPAPLPGDHESLIPLLPPTPRRERPRAERGAHRAGRHGKPRGRHKGGDGER